MKRLTLSVICLLFAVVACGVPVMPMTEFTIFPSVGSAPVPVRVNMDTHINTEESTDVIMIVTAERLHIRTAPNGKIKQAYFIAGDTVTLYGVKVVGEYNWCRISPDDKPARYVGCEWLKVSK